MSQSKTVTQSSLSGEDGSLDYVTFRIADQLFGLPVNRVQDIINHTRTTKIPLAPPEIAGALNLRGRIVTAMDVRCRLGMARADEEISPMSIVVDLDGELYSLIVDEVGEVLSLNTADLEKNPPTLDSRVRDFSNGIYRLQEELLVSLEVERLFDYGAIAA